MTYLTRRPIALASDGRWQISAFVDPENDATLVNKGESHAAWQPPVPPAEVSEQVVQEKAAPPPDVTEDKSITTETLTRSATPAQDEVGEVTTPSLTINNIAYDNAVSIYEGQFGLELSGSSSQLARGSLITLTLAGKTWQGWVEESDGTWYMQVSSDEVAALPDGQYMLDFNASDPSGNTASASRSVWLVTHATSEPHFIINDVTSHDISRHDGESWVRLSGTLDGSVPVVAARVNPNDFPLYDLVFGENRTWSVEIRVRDLQYTDGENNMLFGVKDVGGNWFEHPRSVKINLHDHAGAGGLDAEALGLQSVAPPLLSHDPALPSSDTDATTVLNAPHPESWQNTAADTVRPLSSFMPFQQENTLADLLEQHQLQQQTL